MPGTDASALYASIAELAEKEAANARRCRPVQMGALRRHRFDPLVIDAAQLLRAVPFVLPATPSRRAQYQKALRQARRLSQRPREWRDAFRSLAEDVRAIPKRDWTIEAAMGLEAAPALLALWIRPIGAFGIPLLVRDGAVSNQKEIIGRLELAARACNGKGGAPRSSDDNFDAAVFSLLRAFAWATRQHQDILRSALSNAANGSQRDTGPGARFVLGAIEMLAPEIIALLGPQAVTAAVRRLRGFLSSKADLQFHAGKSSNNPITY